MSHISKLLLLLSLTVSLISCEDSFYKFRLYKTFVQELFEKNINTLFRRAHHIKAHDIEFDDLNGATLTNVYLEMKQLESAMND